MLIIGTVSEYQPLPAANDGPGTAALNEMPSVLPPDFATPPWVTCIPIVIDDDGLLSFLRPKLHGLDRDARLQLLRRNCGFSAESMTCELSEPELADIAQAFPQARWCTGSPVSLRGETHAETIVHSLHDCATASTVSDASQSLVAALAQFGTVPAFIGSRLLASSKVQTDDEVEEAAPAKHDLHDPPDIGGQIESIGEYVNGGSKLIKQLFLKLVHED